MRALRHEIAPGSLAACGLVVALLSCTGPTPSPAGEQLGPRVAAPQLVPAVLRQPRVEPPALGWPALASPGVEPARLERPALVDPELLDPYQVDLFLQKTLVVDVLWVVDNSGSMANERSRLADSFEHFMSVLAGRRIDYHVGVVSTSLEGGQGGALRRVDGRAFIDAQTPNPVATFARMVEFPAGRERLEQGLEAMRLALSEPLRSGNNADFARQDGALAVVVVSDEDDGSFGEPSHFLRFLQHSRQPGDEGLASFSAIVGLPPEGCTPEGEEHIFGADVAPAPRYIEVVAGSAGLQGSICDTDFDPLLEALGRRVSALTRIFPLSSLPQIDTLSVHVDGQRIPPSDEDGLLWSYRPALRAIVFEERAIPSSGAELRVAYVVDLGESGEQQ